MPLNLFAFFSFVFVTTFTPGPNNISSASMGVLYGHKQTRQYRLGIAVGFFLLMLLCGWISTALLRVFPPIENVLRFVGAAYILWLAYETLRASYTFEEGAQPLLGFNRGLWLQILNPKVIVYGLTLYTTFLVSITTYFMQFYPRHFWRQCRFVLHLPGRCLVLPFALTCASRRSGNGPMWLWPCSWFIRR